MKKIILDFAGGTTKEVKCSDEVYDRIVKIIKGEQGFGFNKPVRKKRKFVGMTNEEYLGFRSMGCPQEFELENHIRNCEKAIKCGWNLCDACWNLPAKRNGRYILKEVKE